MKQLLAIAAYTFQEAVRNKILYSIVFFAVALIFVSLLMGTASLAQDRRILIDVGFFALFLFTNLIAIFVGVTLVYQEMERKTIYSLLSKPVPRPIYFLGKFGGIAMTLAVQLAIMALVLTVVMWIRGDPVNATHFHAVWLTWIGGLVVAALSLFFSSFSTPWVSGFLALGVWIVGNLIQELENYLPLIADPTARTLLRVVVAVVPEFGLFTLTTQMTYGYDVPLAYVVSATLYAACYGGLFLVSGAAIFSRRDFL